MVKLNSCRTWYVTYDIVPVLRCVISAGVVFYSVNEESIQNTACSSVHAWHSRKLTAWRPQDSTTHRSCADYTVQFEKSLKWVNGVVCQSKSSSELEVIMTSY